MLVYSPLLEWITNRSLFYRAEGVGDDWYEAAIVLYEGTPPSTTAHTIADARVVRGESMPDFKQETFEIKETGNYFVEFYIGSYDRTGDGILGKRFRGVVTFAAFMQVGEVSVSTP